MHKSPLILWYSYQCKSTVCDQFKESTLQLVYFQINICRTCLVDVDLWKLAGLSWGEKIGDVPFRQILKYIRAEVWNNAICYTIATWDADDQMRLVFINQELTTSAYLQSKGSECLLPPAHDTLGCLLNKVQAATMIMDMIPVSLDNMANTVYTVTFIRFVGSLKVYNIM